jgi:hypothetical protein
MINRIKNFGRGVEAGMQGLEPRQIAISVQGALPLPFIPILT